MTQRHKNGLFDLADRLAGSGEFSDRWSIERELEGRGFALARRLFDDPQRGDRLDRMCAAAQKKQTGAKTRPESKGAPRTYSLQQQRPD